MRRGRIVIRGTKKGTLNSPSRRELFEKALQRAKTKKGITSKFKRA